MADFAFAFYSPEMKARIIEGERRARERACEYAIPWDEDKTKFDKVLAIQGDTFNTERYKLFDSPTLKKWTPKLVDSPGLVWSPERNFAYANRLLPRATGLELAQGHKRGEAMFDKDVIVPVLFRHRPEITWEPMSVWMGVTPMEVLTQRQGVRRSKGHVLLGGLGLGWMLWKIAAKKTVKKITVVEISQELLDWYGTELCELVARETGTEIEVICDDVLKHMGEHGGDVRHIIDIWPDYPTYTHYLSKEWQEAIRRVDHFWGWGVLAEPERSRW
jgi:hypothetical protein